MRLIKVDDALRVIDNIDTSKPYDDKDDIVEKVYEIIDHLPTVEAEVVRHGHWDAHHHRECGEYIQGHGYEVYEWDNYSCSYCGKQSPGNSKHNYCPNCGAKMDGITSRGQRANMAPIDDWDKDILNEVIE